MPVIDETFFDKEPLFIPNKSTIEVRASSTPPVEASIDRFIELCERELLINALGVTLFDELQSEILKKPIDPDGTEPNAAQKWIDLVDGRNYTLEDMEYRWEGLRGFKQNSLIAHFVYSSYLLHNNDVLTTTGTVKPKAANADNVTMTPKFIRAWQTFLGMYQGQDDFLHHHNSHHGLHLKGIDSDSSKNKTRSLLQYLNDSNDLDATAFPNFEFRLVQLEDSFNSFGI